MRALLLNLGSMLGWIGVFFVPAAFVVWRILKARKEYEAEAKEPFTDLPLRLPGESTRKAAEEYFEKAMEMSLLLLGVSAFFGFGVAMMPAAQRVIGAPVFGVITIVSVLVLGPRLLKSVRLYWNYQLGFKGERVVAEELNQLLAQGWRVFHDVPFEGFNVDHVVVGPVGVFAVETKTRRKWKDRAVKHPAHVVRWDGNQLTWPSGAVNGFGVDQSERNANTVAEWLTKATGESVACQAVLTFPGWWVEVVGRGAVVVAATKGLHRVLVKCGSTPLPSERIQQIAYQLEQRCRPSEKD